MFLHDLELSSNTFSPCVAISFARTQSFFYCHTPTVNCSLRNIGGLQMPQYQQENCLWQSKNWILHLRPNCLRVGGLASTERHFLVPRQFYPPLLNPGAVRECCLIRVAKLSIFLNILRRRVLSIKVAKIGSFEHLFNNSPFLCTIYKRIYGFARHPQSWRFQVNS